MMKLVHHPMGVVAHPLPPEFALWLEELPPDYEAQAIAPCRFEIHDDADAHARMVVGVDADGARCYMRHHHTVMAQRFDIDEWPLHVPLWQERRVAWRLLDGGWLHHSERTERLDGCQPRHRSEAWQVHPALTGF